MKVGSHRSGSNLVRVALNVTSLTLISHAEYKRSSISSIYSRQQHSIKFEDGGFLNHQKSHRDGRMGEVQGGGGYTDVTLLAQLWPM